MSDLELQRKSMPNEPGVYFFKDIKVINPFSVNEVKNEY